MEMAHSGTFSLYTFLSPHQKKKESPRKKHFSLYVSFHFSSFLFIFPFLHAQKRLTFRGIMTSQPMGKQIRQKNDDAFSICAIAQRERMHLLKSTWILISSLQGQMYDWSGTAPTVSNKMTRTGFLAAFQASMLLMKFCIDGTPVGFGSLMKMTICHVRGWHKYAIKKDGNLLPLLFQVTFASPTICTCLFDIFGLSMLPNVVNKTALTRALNIGKKQGEPENPKDKPDTRKPIFNVRLMLRVQFVIWVILMQHRALFVARSKRSKEWLIKPG